MLQMGLLQQFQFAIDRLGTGAEFTLPILLEERWRGLGDDQFLRQTAKDFHAAVKDGEIKGVIAIPTKSGDAKYRRSRL